jgi:hypothetical protein
VVTSVFLVNLVKFNGKIFFGLVCVTRSLICEVLVLGTESFLCCFTSTTIFLFALRFVWFMLSGFARLPSIQVLPYVTPYFSKRIEFYKFMYLNTYLFVAFHVDAYFTLCCEVLLYFIERVEVVKIKICFEFKLVWNLEKI